MLKHYFKIAFRNLWRQKGYSLINLIGLSISLTTCLLIFLYVQDELSFDDHWKDSENIYRLENRWTAPDLDEQWATTKGDFIFKITENYPEVESAVKINRLEIVIQTNNESFSEKNGFCVDSLFFDVFDFDFLYGDKETACVDPNSIILTESMAKKYFSDDNPLNQELQFLLWGNQFVSKVSAVVEDVPLNSHFHFDFVIPMSFRRNLNDRIDNHGAPYNYSYIKVKDKKSSEILKQKVKKDSYTVFEIEHKDKPDKKFETIFQPIRDIHLYGHAEKEIEANSSVQDIYIFISAAIFLLVIACINYMNLSTARAVKRSREIGIKKVAGAQKKQIFAQFMGESFLITLLSLLISIGFVALSLPYVNVFLGKTLCLDFFNNVQLMKYFFGVLLVGTIMAGTYPALFMSGFSPISAIKSNSLSGKSNKSSMVLRRILIIIQFTISVLMIISVLTVQRQLSYINDKDLGFNENNLLTISSKGISSNKISLIKERLHSVSGIQSFGSVLHNPGNRIPFYSVVIPELALMNHERYGDENGEIWIRSQSVWGEDTYKTLELDMASGRWFSDNISTDYNEAFILNEAAVKEYDLIDPIGKEFWYTWYTDPPNKGTIIGIVKDFHYADFKTEIEPLMIHVSYTAYFVVRLYPGTSEDVINDLADLWKEIAPDTPFEYYFVDETFAKLHENDTKLGVLTTYFAFFALAIACFGLFGLALFMIEQRSKEIAIRKILGSSISNIIQIIFKEFFWLTIISNIIAWYPAYYFMNSWLGNYSYRVDISLLSFCIAFIVSFVIIIISISYKTVVTAIANPVKYLRCE
jgi:putative ABC transport system permease protein